ncbi:MAG: type I restriction endonuclease subunit R, partial [Microcoleus sp. CSU_2_2]|nr:type I restriction endonuclease subunit R [Microcoleus sp. CSU_2_2]
MAKVIAVTDAIKSQEEAESRLNLSRTEDEAFFTEWQVELPSPSDYEQTALDTLRRRLLDRRAAGELLEGSVTLLVASPL